MKDIYQVIKKVRISEKATMLQETTGELVFEVDRDANLSLIHISEPTRP